jgi:hypothetical protein
MQPMKKSIVLYTIIAAVFINAPVSLRAQDKPAKKSDAAEAGAPGAKNRALPFQGKVTELDSTNLILTVKSLKLTVASTTKIDKNGQPAILADIKVGEVVRGSYKKDETGKLEATVIHIGEKDTGNKKKAEPTK